jgi:hypothetical protein
VVRWVLTPGGQTLSDFSGKMENISTLEQNGDGQVRLSAAAIVRESPMTSAKSEAASMWATLE